MIAQLQTTNAWDASARGSTAQGLQNSVALLLHLGKLFQLFRD